MARVEVVGLGLLQRDLRRAGVATDDLRDAWQPIGRNAVNIARSLAPARTGKLRNSIRASRAKKSLIIRAGGVRSAPYAPFVHYGARTVPNPTPFLSDMLSRIDPTGAVERAINGLLRGLV